jgi:hypothetical protein
MSGSAEITSVIGIRLKDRPRAIEWEPIPRLAYLLAKLQEQCNKRLPHPGTVPAHVYLERISMRLIKLLSLAFASLHAI